MLLDKAVNEYNKLLARYNELQAKQANDHQLLQSQSLLLHSKDEAMRAQNGKIAELERKLQIQSKEMAAIKQKAQEEKDQLFAEARAHERAKI